MKLSAVENTTRRLGYGCSSRLSGDDELLRRDWWRWPVDLKGLTKVGGSWRESGWRSGYENLTVENWANLKPRCTTGSTREAAQWRRATIVARRWSIMVAGGSNRGLGLGFGCVSVLGDTDTTGNWLQSIVSSVSVSRDTDTGWY